MKTPKETYQSAAKDIDDNLKAIISDWTNMKIILEAQLKEKPNSWEGMGRGSELADIESKMDQLQELIEMTYELGLSSRVGLLEMRAEGKKQGKGPQLHTNKPSIKEASDALHVSFRSKSDMEKAQKVVDQAGFTVDDVYNLTLSFKEDELDALEKELDKLLVKNNIQGYEFEAGKL